MSKLPPQNIEAEKSVLSSIISTGNNIALVMEHLTPNDFYMPDHGLIFDFICKLWSDNKPVDIVSLGEMAVGSGKSGLVMTIAELSDFSITAGNLFYHVEIVKGKAQLRRMITEAQKVIENCYSGVGEAEQIIDECEQSILQAASQRKTTGYSIIDNVIDDSFNGLKKRAETKDPVTGVPSGYEKVDYMTCGFQLKDLIILAGRPSMGKTAIAMNMVQRAAIQYKIPVGVFSLEMGKEQLGDRMMASMAQVQGQRIRTGNLREADWPKLMNATNQIKQAVIAIDDTPALSILEVRARARRMKQELNIGMVVIDYLQLMRGTGKSQSREQEISEISRGLKALAKELNIPVIALSQLNRSLESRPNKRPLLSDLRESGAIEQDADVIMFIYRDEVYNKADDNPNKGIAELIIGKQRNGPTGTVKLAFLNGYGRFEDLATNYE